MRHGEASNQCFTTDNTDALRPLTTLGVTEAKRIGQWLVQNQFHPTQIFVSPYLRAQQTCNNVIKVLNDKGLSLSAPAQNLDFITPEGDVQQTHDFIDGLLAQKDDTTETILLVSHMPFVSYLVAQLTQSQNTPIFATGAIARIDYDPALMQGQLIDVVTPAQL